MTIDTDLVKAQEIVDYLHDRIQDLDGENLPEPFLEYSKYTLCIRMDDRVLWESESSGHENLTAEFCWEGFVENCRILAKYIPTED